MPCPSPRARGSAPGGPPLTGAWRTSLDHAAYVEGVAEVRRRIAAGTVYQVNLCRVMEHDLPEEARLSDLGSLLAAGNPAPYAATIDLPEVGLELACASPEAYLVRHGDRVTSRPIKGTAPTSAELLPKDYAENVMIVDLVRHDLGHVSLPGTVEVDHLCRVEEHPGLVHLVSDVSGTLRPGTSWLDLFDASFPPGSVSGAPKHTALQAIADLEPVPRGPYCGAVGWVDADRDEARAGRRHPHLLGGPRRRRAARAAVRDRRRHHVGERCRGGVARDRAQGGAPRGTGHG